jgi:hypothetical protein
MGLVALFTGVNAEGVVLTVSSLRLCIENVSSIGAVAMLGAKD